MEKGLIFALVASVVFALNIVMVRKATARAGESFTATAVSVFIGVPYFTIVLFFTNEWHILLSISWRALILLASAGIIHFVVGRTLSYNAFRLIGANKAATFTNTTPFYTVIFSVLFLKESLTTVLVLGVICIFTGLLLVTTERKSVAERIRNRLFSLDVAGILAALGAALCWGITPVLIKTALGEIGSPFVGAFVSYTAASIVMSLLFFRKETRERMVSLPFLNALFTMVMGGLFAATGQLFLFIALSLSPASLVSPLVSVQIFFIFLFSFFLNRQIEVFTLKVILGMIAIVTGTFLLFQ